MNLSMGGGNWGCIVYVLCDGDEHYRFIGFVIIVLRTSGQMVQRFR